MTSRVTNIVVAGLGGQGVLKASDILGEAAFQAGFDVKKAEVHGMSQRGGSVACDIRYGEKVQSPMVPVGEADVLLVLEPTQIDNNKHVLKPGGVLITPDAVDENALENRKSLNVALLGVLSGRLDLSEDLWMRAIRANLPEKLHEVNERAFRYGRSKA
jgi:indolepyruvate ferredoxin oxidoreductase beta subunit